MMRLEVNKLAGARAGMMIFSDISFHLENGQALIVTGANGSGKSTLLRIIAGLLTAHSGSVEVVGDQDKLPGEQLHYLGHANGLKAALSVVENLGFWQGILGSAFMDIEAALAALALHGVGHLPVANLSAGQKRRVSIAKLLVSDRPVWVVDEPTATLDKSSEKLFEKLMEDQLARGGIIIAATHQPLNLDSCHAANIKYLNIDDNTRSASSNQGWM